MAVTIKDVALKAGVSTTTVSKVINNIPTISEATSSRIRSVMKELDYHPNRRAQNFARQSSRTILYVSTLNKNIAFNNPHMFETLVGLHNALAKKNYGLTITSVTKENCISLIEEIISQKIVDGIVFHVSVVSKELEKLILKEEMPHIILGCPEHKTKLSWIDNNNALSGEMAAKYILSLGYNRIAFIGGNKNDIGSTYRFEGVLHAITQANIYLNEDYLLFGDSSIESGVARMKQLLALKVKPDAVICANNYLALGALKALQESDLRVPEDVGLITFDSYPFATTTNPTLTTVDIDVYDLGKQAGESILQILKKPNLKIQSYRTLANLVYNHSTRLPQND